MFTCGVFPLSRPRAQQHNRIESHHSTRYLLRGALRRDVMKETPCIFNLGIRPGQADSLNCRTGVPKLAARHCVNISMIFSTPHPPMKFNLFEV